MTPLNSWAISDSIRDGRSSQLVIYVTLQTSFNDNNDWRTAPVAHLLSTS